MSMIVRAFRLASFCPLALLCGAYAGFAQPSPAATAAQAKPHAAANPFASDLTPWFSLTPEGSSLIRNAPSPGYDLTPREDQTYVTVFAKKKPVDPRPESGHDFSAPTWSDIGLPKDIPIGPPGSCSSGAYRTIGGQPATGADLMGGLGGDRC